MARAKQVPEAEGSSRTRRHGCTSVGAPLWWQGSRVGGQSCCGRNSSDCCARSGDVQRQEYRRWWQGSCQGKSIDFAWVDGRLVGS